MYNFGTWAVACDARNIKNTIKYFITLTKNLVKVYKSRNVSFKIANNDLAIGEEETSEKRQLEL
ncbi:hypothetical protein GCM10027341_53290 [Spirosoma knui]